jgi:hypothetical protein
VARAQLPPAYRRHPQSGALFVAPGARIIDVEDSDGNNVSVYTTRTGGTLATFPIVANSEGEFNAWVASQTVEITYHGDDDIVTNPVTREVYSGDDIENMLTVDDIPGFPSNVISPTDFGGDPTGATDSTTALQAALDAAIAINGTLDLGTGDARWKCEGGLTVSGPGDSAFRITSTGSGGKGGVGGAEVCFTGDDADLTGVVAFNFDSVQRFEIDHVTWQYSNTGFTGSLMRLNDSTADVQNIHIHHCRFEDGPTEPHIATLSADVLLETRNDLVIAKISECHFDGAENNLVRLGHPTAGGNVNSVSIKDCAFNDIANHERGQIEIQSAIVQALNISGCSFEGASHNILAIRGANASDAIDTRTNLIYQMTVEHCWTGDHGPGTRGFIEGINGVSDAGPVVIRDNFIGTPSSSTAITAGDDGCGFLIEGNRVNSNYIVGSNGEPDSTVTAVFISNVGGDLFDPADPPTRWSSLGPNNSHVTGKLGFSTHADFDDLATWEDDEILVVGGHVPNATGLLSLGGRVAAYSRAAAVGGVGGSKTLVLQGATEEAGGGVQIVAGTTPGVKVHANGTGLGFHGATPVAKPTITGSRGGNAALADLLTKLASAGLITDGTSA